MTWHLYTTYFSCECHTTASLIVIIIIRFTFGCQYALAPLTGQNESKKRVIRCLGYAAKQQAAAASLLQVRLLSLIRLTAAFGCV